MFHKDMILFLTPSTAHSSITSPAWAHKQLSTHTQALEKQNLRPLCVLGMIKAPLECLLWSTSQTLQGEHKGLIFSPKTVLFLGYQNVRAQSHKVQDGLSSLFSLKGFKGSTPSPVLGKAPPRQ